MTAARSLLRPAVFLDRDGVINQSIVRNGKPYPPRALSELTVTSGAREACELMRAEGLVLAVVTNQPDISRGLVTYSIVTEINAYLQSHLGLDSIWVCPHDDADRCSCRKPAPGLLLQAADHHGIDLRSSFMVGDRWRDIEAGRSAGCRTVLIHHPDYDDEPSPAPTDYTTSDLVDAASWIVTRHRASTCTRSATGGMS